MVSFKCECCYVVEDSTSVIKLPDGTWVCERCRRNILYVNGATNAGYSRSIEALQKTALSDSGEQNTAKAVDWIYAQAKEKETQIPMLGLIGASFLPEILEERRRQVAKFGEQNHNDLIWLAILVEEVGECAKAILEKSNLREELIQVVAVIFAWIECKERNEGK